jgi:Mn2+/Fe2+ NRAMP family transporter
LVLVIAPILPPSIVSAASRSGNSRTGAPPVTLPYSIILAVTALAVGMNFLGFNPMKALVWSGIVQGFSVPPLLLIMMILTIVARSSAPAPTG